MVSLFIYYNLYITSHHFNTIILLVPILDGRRFGFQWYTPEGDACSRTGWKNWDCPKPSIPAVPVDPNELFPTFATIHALCCRKICIPHLSCWVAKWKIFTNGLNIEQAAENSALLRTKREQNVLVNGSMLPWLGKYHQNTAPAYQLANRP